MRKFNGWLASSVRVSTSQNIWKVICVCWYFSARLFFWFGESVGAARAHGPSIYPPEGAQINLAVEVYNPKIRSVVPSSISKSKDLTLAKKSFHVVSMNTCVINFSFLVLYSAQCKPVCSPTRHRSEVQLRHAPRRNLKFVWKWLEKYREHWSG